MAYQSMETPEDRRSRSRSRRIASKKLTDDDLLVEILSRLLVKSLLRFACVSSSWYNIINSPDNFYRRNKLPPRMYGFIYFSSRPRIPSAERNYAFCAVPPNLNTSDVFIEDASTRLLLPFLPPHDDLSVQDCCNGLVLCECRGPTSPLERTSFVCNPATKTWDRIPRGRNQDLCFIKALAFDPQVSPHYKIVTITLITDGAHNRTEMEILSSETGEWVVYKDCKGDGFLYFSAVQDNFGDVHAFFNGNIHVPDRDELTVMAADIERRVYREMKLPNTTEGDVLKVHLAVVAGRQRCAQ